MAAPTPRSSPAIPSAEEQTVAYRILIAEADPESQRTLASLLKERGCEVQSVEEGEAALRALNSEEFDIAVLDLDLPRVSGLNVLSIARSRQMNAQFIVTSAADSVDSAVEAMKLGACDYIRKPVSSEELLMVISRTAEKIELRKELSRLRRTSGPDLPGGMVGKSPSIKRLVDLIERVAPTRANVLIVGETGTGKELVAHAIHELSDRAEGPFIAVNCSALPASLLESELFGHMKGSFTGAMQDRKGLVEEASGGTLFLDEISTLSPDIQVKLLRMLQERTVQRIGARAPRRVDFRLIAATNQDLRTLVQDGEFREDLFFRLNVFPIPVPPLRERKEDIPLLANYFRTRFAEENDLPAPSISPDTLVRMMRYDWPGNIRELENFIERGVIMGLGTKFGPIEPGLEGTRSEDRELVEGPLSAGWNLAKLEREYIFAALERHRWHQGRTAEFLGINRRTLYRKLREYQVEKTVPTH